MSFVFQEGTVLGKLKVRIGRAEGRLQDYLGLQGACTFYRLQGKIKWSQIGYPRTSYHTCTFDCKRSNVASSPKVTYVISPDVVEACYVGKVAFPSYLILLCIRPDPTLET